MDLVILEKIEYGILNGLRYIGRLEKKGVGIIYSVFQRIWNKLGSIILLTFDQPFCRYGF